MREPGPVAQANAGTRAARTPRGPPPAMPPSSMTDGALLPRTIGRTRCGQRRRKLFGPVGYRLNARRSARSFLRYLFSSDRLSLRVSVSNLRFVSLDRTVAPVPALYKIRRKLRARRQRRPAPVERHNGLSAAGERFDVAAVRKTIPCPLRISGTVSSRPARRQIGPCEWFRETTARSAWNLACLHRKRLPNY